MFESVEDVQQQFRDAQYIASRRISTVVFLAARMGRPVLIEGPAGVGKTELAKTLSEITERAAHPPAVLRGPRRGQGALRVEVRQAAPLHAAPARADRRADRRRALAARRGRQASPARTTRSSRSASCRRARCSGDPGRGAGRAAHRRDRQGRAGVRGLPARGAVGLPGLGPRAGHRHAPGTSPSSCSPRTTRASCRDGLKRRCLHLFIDFPAPADELEIIRLKVPEIPEQLARAVVAAVQKIRAMDLRKPPSVSESLDWARSLVILNAQAARPGARRVDADHAGQVREGPRARQGRARQGARRHAQA